jgi:3-oxoacyl-[acyl-carrier protein] reductase
MKTAIVTGGARGIGLAISGSLASLGFDLLITGRKPETELSAILKHLRTLTKRVYYFSGDLSIAENRISLYNVAVEKLGVVSLLVNNAGIAPPQRLDVLETTEASYDAVMDTNLKASFFLSQALAKHMIEKQISGKIINISSVSATMASTNRAEYCISKAGIAMMTQILALRLAEVGIGVYEIRPGVIATDMTSGVKSKYDQLISSGLVPQNRWGEGLDIAKAVNSIVSGHFDFSTGNIFVVDGGLSLAKL